MKEPLKKTIHVTKTPSRFQHYSGNLVRTDQVAVPGSIRKSPTIPPPPQETGLTDYIEDLGHGQR